ncbi:MAG: Fis family transcriptional regulator [Polyangiaceae bacterium]|nr:Fis family transcriptional regulator [Polyangiaceae bacterium]
MLQRITSLLIASTLVVTVACGDDGSDSDEGGSSNGGSNAGGDSTGNANGGGDNTGGTADSGEPASLNGITAAHNEARANVDPPAASPIPPLEWSDDLAAVAQAYAEQCVFEHSGGEYGENLYANTGSTTPQEVVSGWVSEVADYDYASNECSGVCGHYTQVVWADSLRLGCGVATCNENSPFGDGPWQNWVCNYDPPGNWVGEKPY